MLANAKHKRAQSDTAPDQESTPVGRDRRARRVRIGIWTARRSVPTNDWVIRGSAKMRPHMLVPITYDWS